MYTYLRQLIAEVLKEESYFQYGDVSVATGDKPDEMTSGQREDLKAQVASLNSQKQDALNTGDSAKAKSIETQLQGILNILNK